ncbi:MAG: 6,7-dimethyl-8-ribityllumazine synthase [Phycisphaerales bacterium]
MTINEIRIKPDASDLRIGVAQSRYHGWATDRLLRGAVERFKTLGGREASLLVAPASGAWELVAVAAALCERDDLDGVVALGVVIRGETPHFDYICDGVTRGLTELTVKTGLPIGFGVLTCENREQVEARCGGEVGNKGAEAVDAVVESALARDAIRRVQFETGSGRTSE